MLQLGAMSLMGALGALAAAEPTAETSVKRILSEVGYNPVCKSTTNWLILLYVLGPLYGVVIAFVLWAVLVRDRQPAQNSEMNAAALESGFARSGFNEPQSKSWFRTVNRPRSAWQAARSGRSGGGFSMDDIDRKIRLGFLRKVYAILSTQLIVTVAIVIAFIGASFEGFDPSEPTEFFLGIYRNSWVSAHRMPGPRSAPPRFVPTTFCIAAICLSSRLQVLKVPTRSVRCLQVLLVLLIPVFICICVLQCVKNSYPWNYIMLSIFTVAESVFLGIICSVYFGACYGDQVIVAAALTLGIFLALTAFTLQSRFDWSMIGPGLFVCFWILILWSFFTFWLMPFNGFRWQMVLSLLFALLFVGFIIYDTHMIMKYTGIDDYIIAAIELYLDVVNLFLWLLSLLSGSEA